MNRLQHYYRQTKVDATSEQLPEREKTPSRRVVQENVEIFENLSGKDEKEEEITLTRSKNKRSSKESEILDPKQQALRELLDAYRSKNTKRNPLDFTSLSGQQIDLIPLINEANPQRIWNFCVAYQAVAMGRKGTADDVINIGLNKTTPVGLYYFAALTMFYSIEEVSVGRIPPLQLIDRALAELLYAVSPVNKNGKAYTAIWADSIQDLISSLPYNSFEHELITLAPHESEDINGNPVLATTKPLVTLDDIREIGPEAFELTQRYFLQDDYDRNLVAYTRDDEGIQNTAMFAVPRNAQAVNPVNGFGQFVNETPLYQRDLWLTSLSFFRNTTKRDGWSAKTIQLGTHLAIYYLISGRHKSLPRQSQTHMVNLTTLATNDLASFITAEMNSDADQTLSDLEQMASTGRIDFGYLSNVTLPEIIGYSTMVHSRRFWMGSAMCAGTPMPDADSQVIGAGSRFLTTGFSDQLVEFGPNSEEMSALSSFLDKSGEMLVVPALTVRGKITSLSLQGDYTGNDVGWLLKRMVPLLPSGYVYLARLPVTNLNTVDQSDGVCRTTGSGPELVGASISGVISMLQSYVTVGSATGGRDGADWKRLYNTHYLARDTVDGGDFDVTPLQEILSMLVTTPFDPRKTANVFNEIFPVMFGNEEIRPAYQVLMDRKYTVEINNEYAAYRAPVWMVRGHKLAANMFAPSEWGARVAYATETGEGGNFMDTIFGKKGVLRTAAKIGKGIINILAPDAEHPFKSRNGSEKEVMDMIERGELHPAHLAPITHDLCTVKQYQDACEIVESDEFQSNRVQEKKPRQKKVNLRSNNSKKGKTKKPYKN